ncbi:TadE-like protein [Novosphingobium sp. B1]|nr:TadE-like protein [Novosphingobium sp. B1]
MALKKTLRRLRGWRVLQDSRAVVTVEFALLSVPLVVMVIGSFDFAYQVYLKTVVQGALNDVSRTASLEAPDLECKTGTLTDKVQCAIKRRSDVVARDATYAVRIRNFYDFSTVGRSEKLVTDYNKNGAYDAGDCFVDLNENGRFDTDAGRDGVGGADDVSYYTVTVTMPRLFPIDKFLPLSPNYVISGETAVRNQPYARQRIPPTVCV